MGAGDVANFGHAPAINATEGMTLAAVYDPVPGKASDFASRHHGGGGYDEVEAFFKSGLDAVVVTSPAFVHRENVLEAAARKLPVLCEKPIADDVADAESMIAAMANAGAPLSIGYVYRFSPVAQQIKRWLDEGVLGAPKVLRLDYLWHLHGQWRPGPEGNWIVSPYWRGRMAEGGPLVDCGVHFIDLARWWLNSEVVDSRVEAAWVSEVEFDAPDHVWAHLVHANGAQTACELSFSYGHNAKDPAPIFSYDVIGDAGTIRYEREGWRLELRDGNGLTTGPSSSEKGFWEMYSTWRDAIQSGDYSEMPSANDGMIATKIATDLTHRAMQSKMLVHQ